MSLTQIPAGTYKIVHIGNKPQDTQPVYVAPERTGDDLLDDMMELQAFRAHRERERAYAAYLEQSRIIMRGGASLRYATSTIMHLSKAKSQTVSHVPK